jgi:hypothetical protein
VTRVDGPIKVTGAAKYSYDITARACSRPDPALAARARAHHGIDLAAGAADARRRAAMLVIEPGRR